LLSVGISVARLYQRGELSIVSSGLTVYDEARMRAYQISLRKTSRIVESSVFSEKGLMSTVAFTRLKKNSIAGLFRWPFLFGVVLLRRAGESDVAPSS